MYDTEKEDRINCLFDSIAIAMQCMFIGGVLLGRGKEPLRLQKASTGLILFAWDFKHLSFILMDKTHP